MTKPTTNPSRPAAHSARTSQASQPSAADVVLVPLEPPESIPDNGYDEELFQHCRDDDYRALYRALIKRAAVSETAPNSEGYPGIAHDFETMRTALEKIADDYPRSTNEGAQTWARQALNALAATAIRRGAEQGQPAIGAPVSAIAAPEPVEEERYTIPTTELVPAAGKKDWGRAKVGLDGNCGYALLGENLQDGEAEFVEIEGWPEPTYTQEREAWGKALRKLEARLGSGLLRYEVIR